MGKGTKTRHVVLLAVFELIFLAVPIVAALDIRHQWSEMPLWLWPIGALLYAGFVAVMTFLEDRTLYQELPGYEAYTGKARYRLFLGLW